MKALKKYIIIYVIIFILASNFVYAEEMIITENITKGEKTAQSLKISDSEKDSNVNKETKEKVNANTSNTDGNALEVKEPIGVTDIEVSDFNEKMKVKDTQKLNVSIIPEDAVNKKITYISDDINIATVSQNGNIKAVGKGDTKIRIVADNFEKLLDLKVSFSTEKIVVNETYIILKPNEKFQLKAKAFPEKAEQKITYKSTNPQVVSVSTDGVLKSEKIGRSSVVVTNGDLQKIVFVIVNNTNEEVSSKKGTYYKRDFIEDEIKNIISDTETEDIELDGKLYPIILKNMLKKIINARKKIYIDCGKYELKISGDKVNNIENQLDTNIEFMEVEKGVEFILNDYNKLPGEIEIVLSNEYEKYQYVYLYNENKEKFEMIGGKITDNTITTRTAGKYLLTEKKLSKFAINKIYLAIGTMVIAIFAVVYVFIKKKYWFW